MKLESIYNNTRDYGDSPTYYPGHEANGDEVFFGGTNRFLQRFGFMYYGEFSGMSEADLSKAKARIRFYKNDGPNLPDTLNTETPKTLIFESQPFSLYARFASY